MTTIEPNAAEQLAAHYRQEHENGCITPHKLVHGRVTLRRGLLCTLDARGRLMLTAPRRSDVSRAQRVAAIVEDLAESAGRSVLGEGTVVGFADELEES